MASAIQNDPSRKNAVASRSALVTLPPVGDRVELGGPIPPAAFLHYHTPPPTSDNVSCVPPKDWNCYTSWRYRLSDTPPVCSRTLTISSRRGGPAEDADAAILTFGGQKNIVKLLRRPVRLEGGNSCGLRAPCSARQSHLF
jgi:hypothetical protein